MGVFWILALVAFVLALVPFGPIIAIRPVLIVAMCGFVAAALYQEFHNTVRPD